MKYSICVQKTEEGFSVSCPGSPGCWSQGATEQEALENILSCRGSPTMVYTHVLNRGGLGVHSPLDRLRKPLSVAAGVLDCPTGPFGVRKELVE